MARPLRIEYPGAVYHIKTLGSHLEYCAQVVGVLQYDEAEIVGRYLFDGEAGVEGPRETWLQAYGHSGTPRSPLLDNKSPGQIGKRTAE